MKYHILHNFRTSALFKEKSSDHLKDILKLKLLTNFDFNLTSFLVRVINVLNVLKFSTSGDASG